MSRAQAEFIEHSETNTSKTTKQQEEFFLAPPLPKEQEDWEETKTVPEFVAQPTRKPSTVSSPKNTPSHWLELTPPEETHWRNKPSFPSSPESQPLKPHRPGIRDRWVRSGKTQPKGRWEPWGVTPIIEPPDRLYLQENRVKSSAKVHLSDAQLQTILVDEKVHHRIIGELLNQTPGFVYNLRVYYRIRQGLQTVDVGQFSMGAEKRLAPGDRIRFAYPVPITGELDISFVEWKYEDGTQGVSERGVL
ncbi:MAG: hypothetical protein WA902_24290 [Thermosynechococcaceae cyanobacterium]